jgi:hypothetical protein
MKITDLQLRQAETSNNHKLYMVSEPLLSRQTSMATPPPISKTTSSQTTPPVSHQPQINSFANPTALQHMLHLISEKLNQDNYILW